MNDQLLIILAQYGALKLGCERALELLQNPDSSGFDADKVEKLLIAVLNKVKHDQPI